MGVRYQSGFAHGKRKLIDIDTKLVFRDEASGVDTLGIFQSLPCYSCLIDESFLWYVDVSNKVCVGTSRRRRR